jgi:hypothetical protein
MRLTRFGGIWPSHRHRVVGDSLAGVTLASMNIPKCPTYPRCGLAPSSPKLYTVLLPLVRLRLKRKVSESGSAKN